jgi:hypothetical protein
VIRAYVTCWRAYLDYSLFNLRLFRSSMAVSRLHPQHPVAPLCLRGRFPLHKAAPTFDLLPALASCPPLHRAFRRFRAAQVRLREQSHLVCTMSATALAPFPPPASLLYTLPVRFEFCLLICYYVSNVYLQACAPGLCAGFIFGDDSSSEDDAQEHAQGSLAIGRHNFMESATRRTRRSSAAGVKYKEGDGGSAPEANNGGFGGDLASGGAAGAAADVAGTVSEMPRLGNVVPAAWRVSARAATKRLDAARCVWSTRSSDSMRLRTAANRSLPPT